MQQPQTLLRSGLCVDLAAQLSSDLDDGSEPLCVAVVHAVSWQLFSLLRIAARHPPKTVTCSS